MKTHYPDWDTTRSLDDIFEEIYAAWANRQEDAHVNA